MTDQIPGQLDLEVELAREARHAEKRLRFAERYGSGPLQPQDPSLSEPSPPSEPSDPSEAPHPGRCTCGAKTTQSEYHAADCPIRGGEYDAYKASNTHLTYPEWCCERRQRAGDPITADDRAEAAQERAEDRWLPSRPPLPPVVLEWLERELGDPGVPSCQAHPMQCNAPNPCRCNEPREGDWVRVAGHFEGEVIAILPRSQTRAPRAQVRHEGGTAMVNLDCLTVVGPPAPPPTPSPTDDLKRVLADIQACRSILARHATMGDDPLPVAKVRSMYYNLGFPLRRVKKLLDNHEDRQ